METIQQVADIRCIPLRGFKLALLISASHFKTMLKNKYLAYHLTNASFEILIFLLFPSRGKLGLEELNQKQPNETSVTLGSLRLHPSMAFLALFLSLVAPGTVPFSNWHVDTPYYLQLSCVCCPCSFPLLPLTVLSLSPCSSLLFSPGFLNLEYGTLLPSHTPICPDCRKTRYGFWGIYFIKSLVLHFKLK